MDTTPIQAAKDRRRIARAEAAAWIVRLHGPHRTSELEAGFRHWLKASPENALEFERVTAVWESAPHASIAGLPRVGRWEPPSRPRRWALAATLMLASGVGVWMASNVWRDPVYITGIGEQRLVPLEDGTRIALNSDSQVRIEYSQTTRRVRLIRGEAFFEVSHNAKRPFVVIAGDQQVTAVGTAFEVRYETDHIDVTLMEGKVSVAPANEAFTPQQDVKITTGGVVSPPASRGYMMAPGERLTIAQGALTKVDEPRMDVITAWRRGEVMLDDTPLVDAAAEMNRYNKNALVIDESRIAGLRVSGIYHTGDSEGFAQTVANLYGLSVTKTDNQIHLSSAAAISP
jgi:transmembrane sensor